MSDYQVRIAQVPPTSVAVLSHRGDPALVGATTERFIAWRRAAGLPPAVSATYTIFHNNPAAVPAADFRLDLCASMRGPVPKNTAGVVAGVIPGGRRAVLRLVGPDVAPDGGMEAAFAWLCGHWLPRSGEKRAELLLYCQRLAFPPAVPAEAAITDLFLPLEPRRVR